MTTALRLPKTFDEVTEATLIPEDWYELRLAKPPEILPNAALKAWMKENNIKAKGEKLYDVLADAVGFENDAGQLAGLNWVLRLRLVSDNPMLGGRAFTLYCGIPGPGDNERVTPLGQTQEDAKMERIGKTLAAFLGSSFDPKGDNDLVVGDSAMFFINTRFNDFSQREENSIDIGTDPIAVSSFEG